MTDDSPQMGQKMKCLTNLKQSSPREVAQAERLAHQYEIISQTLIFAEANGRCLGDCRHTSLALNHEKFRASEGTTRNSTERGPERNSP
jgi:hypothetical protein